MLLPPSVLVFWSLWFSSTTAGVCPTVCLGSSEFVCEWVWKYIKVVRLPPRLVFKVQRGPPTGCTVFRRQSAAAVLHETDLQSPCCPQGKQHGWHPEHKHTHINTTLIYSRVWSRWGWQDRCWLDWNAADACCYSQHTHTPAHTHTPLGRTFTLIIPAAIFLQVSVHAWMMHMASHDPPPPPPPPPISSTHTLSNTHTALCSECFQCDTTVTFTMETLTHVFITTYMQKLTMGLWEASSRETQPPTETVGAVYI